MTRHPSTPDAPHLILGGAKSGKSSYAESLVTALPPPYIYVATAQALDDEMKDRVMKHRARRIPSWETIETPIRLVETLASLQHRGAPVLVDCMTLWLTNLLIGQDAPQPEQPLDELCTFLPLVDYPLFIVSNEVGSGIVPQNALARRFRDLAGSANQRLAAVCQAVTLVVAGLPLRIK